MSFLYDYFFPSDQLIPQKIQFLQSGFLQPTSQSTINIINSNTGTTLTSEQLILGKFLIRQGTGGDIVDTTPSASELVQFLSPYIYPFLIQPGFYFDICYQNIRTDNSTVTLLLGSGVTSQTTISLLPNTITTIRIFITNSISGTETAYFSILGN